MTLTPQSLDHALALVAQTQRSAFTGRQAREIGFTPRQIGRRVAVGRWSRVGRDVFALAGVAPSPEQRLQIAVLASGGSGSHRSAARMQHLINGHPPRPEVTVAPNRNFRSTEFFVHRQRDVRPEDLTVVDGIRITNPYETLLSLGIAVPQALHERALDRALHRGLVDYDSLVSFYFSKAKQGRDGGGRLYELFCLRDPEMPPAASDLETLLMRVIRESGLPIPDRQVPLGLGDRGVRFDLAYPASMICLEGDGFGTHTIRGMFETDRSRHNAVVLAGWLPLHFTWRMIVHDPPYVVRTIRTALDQRGNLGG